MMTNTNKFSISILLALSLLITQVGGVFAASHLRNRTPSDGVIQSITLETDTSTGVTVVSIDLVDNDQAVQSVRVSLETAIAQGLVVVNGDGQPVINTSALGMPIEIDPASIIPSSEENQHPVGSALATFFSDIPGIDYEIIMAAYEQGTGFGVIAQTLWLTTKLEGDAEIFEAMIDAKQTGDYSAFVLEDGSSPENWGQLKKAILDKGKNNGVGVVMSNSDHPGNGNGNGLGNNGNGNGNGNGNNGEKDKDKEQDKDKGPDKDKDKDKDKKK
jgi:hypothetical protein